MTEEDGTILEGIKQVPVAPVPEHARVSALDVIRGVAIFGILLVNIQAFAFPPAALDSPRELEPLLGTMSVADLVAFWATEILCEMKFVTIFSLLFGVSIGMLARKARLAAADPEPIMLVRFAVLLAIGMVHALLLWYGDILFHYALLGFIVLATLRLRTRVQLALAGGAFVLPLLLVLLVASTEGEHESPGTSEGETADEVRVELQTYSEGSVAQILELNGETWFRVAFFTFLLFSGRTLSCFWLGLLAVELGFVHDAAKRQALFARLALLGLLPGLAIEVARVLYEMQTQPGQLEQFTRGFPVQYMGSFLMALGYIGVLGLWAGSAFLRPVKTGIAAVGRMALTCYLSHTLICVLIFYSYGFGLFGQVPRWSLPFIAVGILVVQGIVCVQWLERFNFGPMEWLWRSITYRKPQEFRRTEPAR